MSEKSRRRTVDVISTPEYDEYVETRILVPPGKRDSDASFLDGLILGALTGAGFVLAFTPPVRDGARRLAQQLGLTGFGAPAPTPAEVRDEVLTRVDPPPDPLSSSPAPPVEG